MISNAFSPESSTFLSNFLGMMVGSLYKSFYSCSVIPNILKIIGHRFAETDSFRTNAATISGPRILVRGIKG